MTDAEAIAKLQKLAKLTPPSGEACARGIAAIRLWGTAGEQGDDMARVTQIAQAIANVQDQVRVLQGTLAQLEAADHVACLFAQYQAAMRTLAGSYRTVEERKAAIAIRDEFEGGIEGHIGTLLDENNRLREMTMCAVLADVAAAELKRMMEPR